MLKKLTNDDFMNLLVVSYMTKIVQAGSSQKKMGIRGQ